MSHKQAKKARKGHPHLHPNWKREKRRMFDEALAKAVTAKEKPAEVAKVKPANQVQARLALASLAGLIAGAGQ